MPQLDLFSFTSLIGTFLIGFFFFVIFGFIGLVVLSSRVVMVRSFFGRTTTLQTVLGGANYIQGLSYLLLLREYRVYTVLRCLTSIRG